MRTLYLECYSGISGDMTAGALLDLGVEFSYLKENLEKLQVPGYTVALERVQKSGISAAKFQVHLEEHHHHDHEHGHGHEHGAHVHRDLHDIREIIGHSGLSDFVKKLADEIFLRVARAEAKAHDKPIDQVHFHEVGAVDSIVDIVSAAILVEALKPDRILCSKLYEGSGHVHCAHGELPVPVPATANILSEAGAPFCTTDVQGEMITPTGAAIAVQLAQGFGPMPEGRILKTGYGAGDREFGHANVLRAYLLETEEQSERELLLETNLDDSTGEQLGRAMELLFGAGALDVFYTPCYMKKCRPAYTLSVICGEAAADRLTQLIFTHLTAIGVRKTAIQRVKMARESVSLETRYGAVTAKRCTYGGLVRCYPEYESAKEAAERCGVPLSAVYAAVEQAAGRGGKPWES